MKRYPVEKRQQSESCIVAVIRIPNLSDGVAVTQSTAKPKRFDAVFWASLEFEWLPRLRHLSSVCPVLVFNVEIIEFLKVVPVFSLLNHIFECTAQ